MKSDKKLSSAPTLDTIYRHRSIRRYTGEPISEAMRNAILEAGRAASSSCFMQCVHVIRVTDAELRANLCRVAANQQYVREAAEFWVFCADYAKHQQLFPDAQVDWTESLIAGAVDAGIMAQNCLLAAESLGLGGVFIGALRNDMARATELLGLPENTTPLFGLCLGHPDQQPLYRPRLPLDVSVSENHYRMPTAEQLTAYDAQLAAYYQQRSGIDTNWTQAVHNNFDHPVRPHVLPFLHRQGLAKR